MEYPIQLFVYLNEQDAEQTRIVSNVIKDTKIQCRNLISYTVLKLMTGSYQVVAVVK